MKPLSCNVGKKEHENASIKITDVEKFAKSFSEQF